MLFFNCLGICVKASTECGPVRIHDGISAGERVIQGGAGQELRDCQYDQRPADRPGELRLSGLGAGVFAPQEGIKTFKHIVFTF